MLVVHVDTSPSKQPSRLPTGVRVPSSELTHCNVSGEILGIVVGQLLLISSTVLEVARRLVPNLTYPFPPSP